MFSDALKSTQDAWALIARVLMSLIFLWSGIGKAMAATATQAYFAKLGLPLPMVAWVIAVVVEVVGGLAVLLGVQARAAAAVLALWCLATAIAGHSDFTQPGNQINFMKNLAMTGGFIFIALHGAGAYSLDRLRGGWHWGHRASRV